MILFCQFGHPGIGATLEAHPTAHVQTIDGQLTNFCAMLKWRSNKQTYIHVPNCPITKICLSFHPFLNNMNFFWFWEFYSWLFLYLYDVYCVILLALTHPQLSPSGTQKVAIHQSQTLSVPSPPFPVQILGHNPRSIPCQSSSGINGQKHLKGQVNVENALC